MQYITHIKFKGKDLTGKEVMISRGKKLERKGDFLYFEDYPICVYRSECAKMHFAINEDSQGMVRGDITHKIAYSDSRVLVNGRTQRFSEKQVEILCSDKWEKFLNKEHDVIIFTDVFFEANVDELKNLYEELNAV